jgi:hypothetical protein
MNLPMETVMKLPIQDRRYFIQRHNEEQEGIRKVRDKRDGLNIIDGETINDFARIEQMRDQNLRRGG